MKQYRVSTGTITYALKGRDLLRRYGFKVRIERMSSGPESKGCGYTLVVSGDIAKAEALLRNAGIKILEIIEI